MFLSLKSPQLKQNQLNSAALPSFHLNVFLLLVIMFLAEAGSKVLAGSTELDDDEDADHRLLAPIVELVAPVSTTANASLGEESGAGTELSVGFPLTPCSGPLP